MAKRSGETKQEWLAKEVAKAVNAGKAWESDTVDFSDPNRPLTCLEVDFPILPINQVAAIEGNAGKPIYQMSKWWARRRSSVFRSMLIAAATKAPDDPGEAAKRVWDAYYGNHQKKGSFKNIKVADIFMGGGTTIVEGSRLGMDMFGSDLNPVAWFVVKNEMADIKKEDVEALLADIEADVKPQIMPFYSCDCPRGHKGQWTQISTSEIMPDDFSPATLCPEERHDYFYQGPEIIHVFWAKHGPCQVTGCGHRTPIMTTPVMAIKSLSVKYWEHKCPNCGETYDLEETDARMAPGVPFAIDETERPFAVLDRFGATCPSCSTREETLGVINRKGEKKKVDLTLLVHPDWLKGEAGSDPDGKEYGGSSADSADATIRWNDARAKTLKLVEVRGRLADQITCPQTGVTFSTGNDGGTVPKRSNYACGACGTVQDVLTTVKASGKTGPVAMYAIQGYCPTCDKEGRNYGGRFFAPANDVTGYNSSLSEWESRKESDLADYWPRSELPFGFMTHKLNGGIPNHGFTHWWKMFNPRQLLVQTQLLCSILNTAKEEHSWNVREYVLGAFQQFLRNDNMFCFWHKSHDHFAPALSNSNFHPKSGLIEIGAFSKIGYGPWQSTLGSLFDSLSWKNEPWELAANERTAAIAPQLTECLSGKSERVFCGDLPVNCATVETGSATELENIASASHDLLITDPPFGGLLHYSELSDFFYVWLRLALKDKYPDAFGPEFTPKTLEVVANRARQPEDPDGFYQRLLTASWKEANRVLKPGGILSFTFHHSEDAPWVQVLESLFDAGFYLEATYPIRSDETKGKGEFGSRKVEYDIIHVCRKRTEEPVSVSWAKMRREVIRDVRQLQDLLEQHETEGIPEADLQVIRRGKSLEYFSRHYGKVFVDEDKPISVLEALAGINQLLDEEAGNVKEPPPVTAEPFTRQFLRLFDGITELPRDQIQKFLRGTGIGPEHFVKRGWCSENKKIFYLTSPLEIAKEWVGKHRQRMISDYDQAAWIIGACFDGSGINVNETLSNPNFRPHPALGPVLEWQQIRGSNQEIRNAAARANRLYRTWLTSNTDKAKQLDFFLEDDD